MFLFTMMMMLITGCGDSSADEESTKAEEPQTETTSQSSSSSTNSANAENNFIAWEDVNLPDLVSGLETTGCDDGPGQNGAVSYFYAEFKDEGKFVIGQEKWLLFANKKWKENKAKPGKDCEVKWTLKGRKVRPQGCGHCAFGVQMRNFLVRSASSCPRQLTAGESGKIIKYDFDLAEDGTVGIYFAGSGKKVFTGYHRDGFIRGISRASCRWF